MKVEVVVPSDFQGEIIAQLSKRNGVIIGTDEMDQWFTLVAEVPLNDMFGYATELRTMTQGKGEYTMEYARYTPARGDVQGSLIRKFREEQEKAQAAKN